MAITLEIGVGHLLPEFLADALVFLGPFQTAGAVTAGALQTFLDHLDHFLVIVQTYSHGVHILSDSLYDREEKCQGWGRGSGSEMLQKLKMLSFILQSSGLHSERKGLSHGLKTVHRTVFTPVCELVPPFQVPHTKNKRTSKKDVLLFLVGEAGLEPARPQ